MILILTENAGHTEAEQLIDRLLAMGLRAVKEQKQGRIAIAIVQGLDHKTQIQQFEQLPFHRIISLQDNDILE
jgi:hypothetical protein